MITERVVEVRVRAVCDACKRNQGIFRRQLHANEQTTPAEVVKLGESWLEGEDALTGQRWMTRRGLHICPVCAKSVQATAAVFA